MALRQALGSEGEVMRPESKPCSRLMRQTAGIFTVGGALAFWVLCRLHYVYRAQVLLSKSEVKPFCCLIPCLSFRSKDNSPKKPQVGSCGAVTMNSASLLLVQLFSPECEPQNVAAYDKPEHKTE